MSSYVVDASVGIKWFVPEIHSDAALRLLTEDDYILKVPDLFFPEIGNILWKRVRRGEDTVNQVSATLTEFNQVPLEIFDSQPLMSSALDIAMQTNRTVYDCLYLALAIANLCSMVTSDLKLFNSLAGSAFSKHVMWVESFEPIS